MSVDEGRKKNLAAGINHFRPGGYLQRAGRAKGLHTSVPDQKIAHPAQMAGIAKKKHIESPEGLEVGCLFGSCGAQIKYRHAHGNARLHLIKHQTRGRIRNV